MSAAVPVPAFKTFSSTMRVDALLGDWRAALPVEISPQEKEARLYSEAWNEYLAGDYGFGLWCWHETDRLTSSLGGVKEVTRVLGPGRFFGFSHRKAVVERLPLDRIHRPRKGEMSTPRPEAIVLANYQLLCTYLVHARKGDPKAKAQYEIALLDLEDRRRTDPYLKFFETFRTLLERPEPTAGGPGKRA
jgi:hypothetical protein